MGGGTYSFAARATRTAEYKAMSQQQLFAQKTINNAMSPNGVDVRECRDNDEHPNTTPIILALDVTGSMGSIPTHLIKEGLPTMMKQLLDAGATDPTVMFTAIGDHECDQVPLQVGQFEASDELMDHWLTKVYLEGGGGGNSGESYLLAWYFAAKHTSIDSFEKRGKKGYLFTIGDEPTLPGIPGRVIKDIMGCAQASDISAVEILDEAQKKYEVYHLHLLQGSNGRNPEVQNGWKQLLGDRVIMVENKEDVPDAIVRVIAGTTIKKEEEEKEEAEEEIL